MALILQYKIIASWFTHESVPVLVPANNPRTSLFVLLSMSTVLWSINCWDSLHQINSQFMQMNLCHVWVIIVDSVGVSKAFEILLLLIKIILLSRFNLEGNGEGA